MKADARDDAERIDQTFEQSLFVHDRLLWQKLYDPEPEDVEQDVEWITPRGAPGEFAEMMAELQGMGLVVE